jgi:SNF2 family DNA or RNA helicase
MLVTLDGLIESLEGRKILLGCWYNESVESVAAHLHKLKPVMVYGKNTEKEREEAKHKFINDPDCRVAVTNYLSGGVGIDGFQSICSHAIAMEMVTVPGYFEQWSARINRGGQENPMTIYLVVPRGTIAVRLRRNLLTKEAVANQVIGDRKQLMRELLGEGE